MNISQEEAEKIFEEQSAYVYRLALFLTKSSTLSEDIMQDTFIQVFQVYPQYDSNRPIQPWIYKITLNTVRKTLRKRHWTTLWNRQHKNESLEEMIVKDEANEQLWDEVSSLSFKSREVIYLHYYLDLKFAEIAEILNIPIGTCKSRLNTALKSLRKKIPECEYTMKPSSRFGG